MNGTEEDREIANLLNTQEDLFVLWMIYNGICKHEHDFGTHFGVDYEVNYILESLQRRGFVKQVSGLLDVTALGLAAITQLGLGVAPTFEYQENDLRVAGKVARQSFWDKLVGFPFKRSRRTESLSKWDPAAIEIEADPALELAREELAASAMDAFNKLPERDRAILYSIVIRGKSYRQVAREMELSVSLLHGRVKDLTSKLAVLISQSRRKKPSV